jgi:tetratricopeptide (TPR) repeat protein
MLKGTEKKKVREEGGGREGVEGRDVPVARETVPSETVVGAEQLRAILSTCAETAASSLETVRLTRITVDVLGKVTEERAREAAEREEAARSAASTRSSLQSSPQPTTTRLSAHTSLSLRLALLTGLTFAWLAWYSSPLGMTIPTPFLPWVQRVTAAWLTLLTLAIVRAAITPEHEEAERTTSSVSSRRRPQPQPSRQPPAKKATPPPAAPAADLEVVRPVPVLLTETLEGSVEQPTAVSPSLSLLQQADAWHAECRHEDALQHLEAEYALGTGATTPDLLWRLARSLFAAAAGDSRRADLERALDLCRRATRLDPACFGGHKWAAVILGSLVEYYSTTDQIASSATIKNELDAALALRDDDATCHHVTARWCVEMAGIGWAQRRIAASLFGEIPTATLDEALGHFVRAAELDPSFKLNWYHYGRCLDALGGGDEEARRAYKRAADLPATTDEERTVDDECAKRLR